MLVFYFSATGNCLHAAKSIGGTLYSIPQELRTDTKGYRDEAIGFVFPVFDGTYPRILEEFLNAKRFEADYFPIRWSENGVSFNSIDSMGLSGNDS